MKLSEKQRLFTQCVARLILYAESLGYELTLGHAERCRDCHIGLKRSLHKSRLAIDLNLFKNGKYLKKTKDHQELGEYWERLGNELGVPLCWGGRFGDGGHYSFSSGGRK